MFVLNATPLYWATVRFDMPPGDAGGERLQCSFQARFPRMSAAELEEFGARARSDNLTDRQIATELLKGWGDDVRDAAGQPLPYTPENVQAVLNVAGLGSAVATAFRDSQPRAVLGN